MPKEMLLQPGSLWQKVINRTQYALQTGALQSIPTDYEFIEQNGINFLVRTMANLARKHRAKKHQEKQSTKSKDYNPFLPYDEDLFVADISETHLCLLNKFNVVNHHLLIITRAFEDQETWLTQHDFAAMLATLAEIDGLAFYNGGKIAGASQKHKHLQIVPLPLVPQGHKIPIESAIAAAEFNGAVGTIPLPFVNALAHLDPSWMRSPVTAAAAMLECYYNLLQAVGLIESIDITTHQQSGAYNLLATREWMLLIPRSQECFESISVNSLGFAGSLFVRDTEQMKLLKAYGPIAVLQNVAQS